MTPTQRAIMAFINQVPDEAVDAEMIASDLHADAALIAIDLRILRDRGSLIEDEMGRGYFLLSFDPS